MFNETIVRKGGWPECFCKEGIKSRRLGMEMESGSDVGKSMESLWSWSVVCDWLRG